MVRITIKDGKDLDASLRCSAMSPFRTLSPMFASSVASSGVFCSTSSSECTAPRAQSEIASDVDARDEMRSVDTTAGNAESDDGASGFWPPGYRAHLEQTSGTLSVATTSRASMPCVEPRDAAVRCVAELSNEDYSSIAYTSASGVAVSRATQTHDWGVELVEPLLLRLQCRLCQRSMKRSVAYFTCCQQLLTCWGCALGHYGLASVSEEVLRFSMDAHYQVPSLDALPGSARRCVNKSCSSGSFQFHKVELDFYNNAMWLKPTSVFRSLAGAVNGPSVSSIQVRFPALIK